MSKTYRNASFTKRNYECANIVACISDKEPEDGRKWIEADESALSGLAQIMIVAGVRYYGYL